MRREHENQNFFHYEVDGTTLKTNIAAFSALKTARLKNPRAKPKFILDFDFLKNPDKNLWQTEPPESLSFYMEKHAVLLSEKFNKIILFYSGGTDSHPIAETFARCGIPVELLWWGLDLWPCGSLSHLNKWEKWDKPDLVSYVAEINKTKKVFTYQEIITQLPTEAALYNFLVDASGPFDQNSQPWNYPGYCTDGEGGIPLNFKTRDTDCVVAGMEKPCIRLRQGWWFHSLGDGTLTYCPDESTNFVWFYITDLVPELHVKCSWLKMKAIENILNRERLPFTDGQVMSMQQETSPYYKAINDASGMIPLNRRLSLPGNKQHADPKMSESTGFNAMESFNKAKERFHGIEDFWESVVVPSVEPRYTNLSAKAVTAISTPLIPLKRMSGAEKKEMHS